MEAVPPPLVEVTLSPLGERVARDGASVSRRAPGEGVRFSCSRRPAIQERLRE